VNKTEAARNNAYHRLYGPFDIKNPRELPKRVWSWKLGLGFEK
jgi:hypothetical protein